MTSTRLRADALQIWHAGVAAVRADRLVREHLRVVGTTLPINDEPIDLGAVRRIVVVGAGKAGAGMALGVEQALGPELMARKQVGGWVNVPADCMGAAGAIHLHPARPGGVNQPRPEGVDGTEHILSLVSSLAPDDLCICLISGGGSALPPAPAEGISLADKVAVTEFLSAAGANISELNTVRKHLSRIKGGGLARACTARRMVTLVISDVLGDPLDLIASGPTVPHTSTPGDALAVLERFGARQAGIAPNVFAHLERQANLPGGAARPAVPACQVTNIIIGNNATAVDAAGMEAERLGYSHAMIAATTLEGAAEDIGVKLASDALWMRDHAGPNCLISGGEPTVKLVDTALRGRGGRNQQLALAAATALGDCRGIALLSGGTDGEDGPTDAAGAVIDASIMAEARRLGLDANDYLRRNDAYSFFDATGGLIRTGPTHTNVCDVRVVLVEQVIPGDH